MSRRPRLHRPIRPRRGRNIDLAGPTADRLRALQNGILVVAEGTARELGRISLAEALELTILIASKEPRRLSKVSSRCLERYLVECEPSLAQVALAVSALSGLRNAEPREPLRVLRALIDSF